MIERDVLVWNELLSSAPDDDEELEEEDDDISDDDDDDSDLENDMQPNESLSPPVCNFEAWAATPDRVQPLVANHDYLQPNTMHAPHRREVIVRNQNGSGDGRPTEQLIPPTLNFDTSELQRRGY